MPETTPRHLRSRWRTLVEALFTIDLRSLAVFRAGLGLLLLTDLAWRARDLEAFYTDFGTVPRVLLSSVWEGRWYLCLHAWRGDAGWQWLLFACAAGAAALLTVGRWTRTSSIAAWLLLISLQNRNPAVLQGGDSVMRLVLFWSMFLPLGARWSLDARRLRRTPANQTAAPGRQRATPPRAVCSVASAALLLQVAYVYVFAVAFKTDPAWMLDGSAVWLTLSIDQLATPFGVWLRSMPPVLLQASTYVTMAFETLGPILAFIPCRRAPQLRMAVVVAFWAFHLLVLGSALRLGHFPWTCALAWVPFLPPDFWERVRRLRTSAGPVHPMPIPGEALSDAGETETSPRRRLATADVVVLLLLIYVTAFNIQSLNADRFRAVFPVAFANWTRLDQIWRMFSPAPPREDGWYVFPATLRDGSVVDLYPVIMDFAPDPGTTVEWAKPSLVSATFRDERWRKFMMYLRYPVAEPYRPGLAAYLRRRWNRDHAPTPLRELAALEMVYMLELTAEEPGQPPAAPERVLLYEQHW